MARNSCDTGRKMYKTKEQAQKMGDGAPVKRCDRCRQWHVMEQKGRRGRR